MSEYVDIHNSVVVGKVVNSDRGHSDHSSNDDGKGRIEGRVSDPSPHEALMTAGSNNLVGGGLSVTHLVFVGDYFFMNFNCLFKLHVFLHISRTLT